MIDSGASSHMTKSKANLHDYKQFGTPERVTMGNGNIAKALGAGSIRMKVRRGRFKTGFLLMERVLYVPELESNLYSIRAHNESGKFSEFGQYRCWLKDQNRDVMATGTLRGKLYCLDLLSISERACVAAQGSWNLWHHRFGHVHQACVEKMIKHELVDGVAVPKGTSNISFCKGCAEGKMHQLPCPAKSSSKTTRKLQLVHSDVAGPLTPDSLGGNRYFVTFIDDFSRCCGPYFMRNKSEVFEKFREFEALVCNESGLKIVALRSDCGGEYMSDDFQDYLKKKGIRHETSVPGKPQQKRGG